MGTYATVTHLNARMAHPGGFGASSTPTSTEIDYWIEEGEALLLGALSAAGGPASYTGAAALQIRSWVLDYVEGQTRKAYAIDAIDVSDQSASGSSLIERFENRLTDIERQPTIYLARLGVGDALQSDGGRMRSYITDNADDRSVANGDFEPIFKVSDLKGNF